jgi:thioredoxin 1
MRKQIFSVIGLFFLVGAMVAQAEEGKGELPEVPTKDMVTMLDLGAKKCIPCKMMAPIIEKLKKEYNGKASIVFIDVWKHHDQVEKYGIRAIPTQIFFDKNGTEVYRNVGFMAEEAIVQQLEKMGIGEDKKNTGHGAQ